MLIWPTPPSLDLRNLTDSLSVQMYQESERRDKREAVLGTLTNFAARFFVCLTFVGIIALSWKHAVAMGIAWGMALLSTMSYLIARARKASAISEIVKHVGVAVLVIAVSEGIGRWLTAHVG